MRQPGELVTIGRAAIELDLSELGVRFAISRGDLRAVTVQRYGTLEQRLRIPESELDRWIRCRWVDDPREHRQANVDRARARVRAVKREAHQRLLEAKRDVRRREAAERAEALAGARRQAKEFSRPPSRGHGNSAGPQKPRRTTGCWHGRMRSSPWCAVGMARGHGSRRSRRCSFEVDGTVIRWRYWPALGKREYVPLGATA
jgi:hypothetical protein